MKREKNIQVFNTDVNATGGYLYTDQTSVSSVIATKRQTDEMVNMIKDHFTKKLRILDIGCGDGIYTLALFQEIKPLSIVGIDPAKNAILAARKKVPDKLKKRITFHVDDIYQLEKRFKKNTFDLIVIRGVLHHLYDPEKAIKKIANIADTILVLEPNGYNPILKIIEKVSPYHRLHEEKSYWPPQLNKWFEDNKYRVRDQRYFSIVPYFINPAIARGLQSVEPFFESIPYVKRFYCGTNLILYNK